MAGRPAQAGGGRRAVGRSKLETEKVPPSCLSKAGGQWMRALRKSNPHCVAITLSVATRFQGNGDTLCRAESRRRALPGCPSGRGAGSGLKRHTGHLRVTVRLQACSARGGRCVPLSTRFLGSRLRGRKRYRESLRALRALRALWAAVRRTEMADQQPHYENAAMFR